MVNLCKLFNLINRRIYRYVSDIGSREADASLQPQCNTATSVQILEMSVSERLDLGRAIACCFSLQEHAKNERAVGMSTSSLNVQLTPDSSS